MTTKLPTGEERVARLMHYRDMASRWPVGALCTHGQPVAKDRVCLECFDQAGEPIVPMKTKTVKPPAERVASICACGDHANNLSGVCNLCALVEKADPGPACSEHPPLPKRLSKRAISDATLETIEAWFHEARRVGRRSTVTTLKAEINKRREAQYTHGTTRDDKNTEESAEAQSPRVDRDTRPAADSSTPKATPEAETKSQPQPSVEDPNSGAATSIEDRVEEHVLEAARQDGDLAGRLDDLEDDFTRLQAAGRKRGDDLFARLTEIENQLTKGQLDVAGVDEDLSGRLRKLENLVAVLAGPERPILDRLSALEGKLLQFEREHTDPGSHAPTSWLAPQSADDYVAI